VIKDHGERRETAASLKALDGLQLGHPAWVSRMFVEGQQG
jgi:hypothetical protein